jgi:hypothetical protein
MPVVDDSGNVRPQLPVTLTTLAGAAVPLYAAATGATPVAATTDAHGLLPGYLDPGTLKMTAGGVERQIEVVSARGGGVPVEPSGDTSGVTDSAVLAAVIAALPSSGGRIELGAGNFYWLTGPSFKETRSVTLIGQGGLSAGDATSTTVTYLGAEARCVDARSTYGFVMEDLFLIYTNAAFTGILVDYQHSIVQDSAFGSIDRCQLQGSGVAGASMLVSLDKAIGMTLRECRFGKCVMAIRGRNGATYSNAVSIERCYFNQTGGNGSTQAPIQDAGRAWTVKGCFFEPIASGAAGAYKAVSGTAAALTFDGCWFGDASGSGTWIDFAGSALIVKGCDITTGATAIKLPASGSRGLVVEGNVFENMTTAVDLGGASGGNHGVLVLANDFQTVTNEVVYGANLPQGAVTHSLAEGEIVVTSSARFRSPAALVLYERTDPGAPAADQGILYLRDNGGKTEACIEFASGAVQVFATQP